MRRLWIEGVLVLALAGWVCFRIPFILLPALPFYVKFKGRQLGSRDRLAMQREFKEVMRLMYSAAASGAALEKTLRDTARDMQREPDRYPHLLPEFRRICTEMDNHTPTARILTGFADRCGDEDIRRFARILIISSKSGGSLSEIIHRTSETISLRLAVNEEIETILAGKRGEFRVMIIVPAGILLYMNLTSPDYMQVLYQGAGGRLIMAGVLAIYILAVLIGQHILDIRI